MMRFDVQVYRDGVPLTGCTSPTAATPDPCVVSRGFAPDGSGDALVTVRTSHFSTWSLGRPAYALTGPLPPLRPLPESNTVRSGATVPVLFRLGGDRGRDVVAAARVTACGAASSTGTTAQSRLPLVYEPRTQTYAWSWQAPARVRGCRDLVLGLRDGSELRVRFTLR